MRCLKLSLFLILIGLTSMKAHAAATIGGMVLFGSGTTGNNTDVLSRSIVHSAIGLFAGVNIKKFRLGLNYEFDTAGQSADPTTLNNTNISGKISAAGLRFDFYDGKQSAGLIYRASEKYTLDKPTLNGNTSTYNGKGSISVQYYRQLRKKIGFVIDYTAGQFTSATANTNDLTWNRISLGLVLTNFASAK